MCLCVKEVGSLGGGTTAVMHSLYFVLCGRDNKQTKRMQSESSSWSGHTWGAASWSGCNQGTAAEVDTVWKLQLKWSQSGCGWVWPHETSLARDTTIHVLASLWLILHVTWWPCCQKQLSQNCKREDKSYYSDCNGVVRIFVGISWKLRASLQMKVEVSTPAMAGGQSDHNSTTKVVFKIIITHLGQCMMAIRVV